MHLFNSMFLDFNGIVKGYITTLHINTKLGDRQILYKKKLYIDLI